jgi:hypothetical protein
VCKSSSNQSANITKIIHNSQIYSKIILSAGIIHKFAKIDQKIINQRTSTVDVFLAKTLEATTTPKTTADNPQIEVTCSITKKFI